MDNQVHNQIVSFIWGIADDCLRDVYVRGKYRDVILPMTVIRRLDAMLEETKPAVLAMKKQLDAAKIDNQWPALCNAAGQAFCNASPFLLKDLTSRAKAQTLKADFIAYLDGFSPNVQVILDKFKFRNQIDTMVDADILGAVIEMVKMLELLKWQGYERASLAVQKENYAVKMYKNVGFKTVDENAEEYIMVCEL